jgi:protein involved in polysaccharide export with SLBB domain
MALDAGYRLKIQNMGVINARNKTYLQMRREVENLVSQNYPMSGPSLTLVRMGSFTVLVSGETVIAGDRSVDGLTRVSALLTSLTDKASVRFVKITRANGATRTYDLFAANRNGDLSQNPYVSPGDTILIPPAERKASIAGEVFRPGTYELLPGEDLKRLVEYYGDGFTLDAAPEKIILTRAGKDNTMSRELRALSWDKDKETALEDGDQVTVENRNANRRAG